MSAKKKTISRALCLVMIVALIVPALLVFPVSASTAIYSYNDVELPAIPGIDMTNGYQNAAIFQTNAGGYMLFTYSAGKITANDYSEYDTSYVGFTFYNSGNTYTARRYYFAGGEWIENESWADVSYSFNLYDGVSTWPNGNECYILDLIWTGKNIAKGYSLYMGGKSPVFVREEIQTFGVLQSWLDTDVYTFVENSSATSFTVAVDGGSITPTYQYQWYYGSSQGGSFNAIPNETQSSFTPKTSAEYVGTSLYFCRITAVLDGVTKSADSGYLQVTVTEEPPSTTDPPVTEPSEPDTPDVPDETTPDYSEKLDDIQGSLDDVNNSIGEVGDKVEELPDKITDGMQDIMEQEKEQATQQGGQFVDDITGVVPNDSQGFIDALGSLVSVLSYDGTECVLPIPALTLPAIDGLFPSYTVMEAQEVDFEEFFSMMPPAILLLVQSLLTVALIVYCFKELYDTVAYFFVLKGGNK